MNFRHPFEYNLLSTMLLALCMIGKWGFEYLGLDLDAWKTQKAEIQYFGKVCYTLVCPLTHSHVLLGGGGNFPLCKLIPQVG